MTFGITAAGFGAAAAGVSAATGIANAAMAGGAGSAASAYYKQGMAAAKAELNQSNREIDAYLSPYRLAGRHAIQNMDSAMDPTAKRDYSMPDDPGAAPKWADYKTRNALGLAGMVKGAK